eukprot:3257563-Rhodomonas_salina.1
MTRGIKNFVQDPEAIWQSSIWQYLRSVPIRRTVRSILRQVGAVLWDTPWSSTKTGKSPRLARVTAIVFCVDDRVQNEQRKDLFSVRDTAKIKSGAEEMDVHCTYKNNVPRVPAIPRTIAQSLGTVELGRSSGGRSFGVGRSSVGTPTGTSAEFDCTGITGTEIFIQVIWHRWYDWYTVYSCFLHAY